MLAQRARACCCAASTGWRVPAPTSSALVAAVRAAAPAVSTRVLLSLREHLLNRASPASVRVFVNRAAVPG